MTAPSVPVDYFVFYRLRLPIFNLLLCPVDCSFVLSRLVFYSQIPSPWASFSPLSLSVPVFSISGALLTFCALLQLLPRSFWIIVSPIFSRPSMTLVMRFANSARVLGYNGFIYLLFYFYLLNGYVCHLRFLRFPFVWVT